MLAFCYFRYNLRRPFASFSRENLRPRLISLNKLILCALCCWPPHIKHEPHIETGSDTQIKTRLQAQEGEFDLPEANPTRSKVKDSVETKRKVEVSVFP